MAITFGGIWIARAEAGEQTSKVNRHSLVIDEFEQRVRKYDELHKKAAAQLPPMNPKQSPAEIVEYQHALANRIRTARPNARKGDIFTPAIAHEFKRLIRLSMMGREAHRIRTSLNRGEPVKARVRVNGPYPQSLPLQTTPPSLLQNLPKLPPEIEYRVDGHSLLLRDTTANLIVDYIPNAVP